MNRKPAGGRRPALKRRHSAPTGVATRIVAADILGAVLSGRPLDAVLAEGAQAAAFADLSPADRALARSIIGMTLRRHGQIEDALGRLMERRLPRKARAVEPILKIAAAQILFLGVPDHAAVGTAIEIFDRDPMLVHWKRLANGVLRSLARERQQILDQQDAPSLNTPDWLMARWQARFGDDVARAIATAHLVEPSLDLTVKSEPEDWAGRLGGIVLPTGTVRLLPHGRIEDLDGYGQGEWWVQDAAAALPARLLGDVAGKTVLDLCAAPGGKTAQLAAAGAHVTAVDVSEGRMARLRANLERLRLDAETVVADAARFSGGPFDAVLLDAPCSSTGTIRRHPDVALAKSEADIAALAELQGRLLEHAASLVAPGGHLVYCTCSLEPEEGIDRIERFLENDGRFVRRPAEADEIGGLGEVIGDKGDLVTRPDLLSHDDPRLAGLDGFFAARLQRSPAS